MPSRDTDIGRPTDGILLEKIALALQILIDNTIKAEDLGEPADADEVV